MTPHGKIFAASHSDTLFGIKVSHKLIKASFPDFSSSERRLYARRYLQILFRHLSTASILRCYACGRVPPLDRDSN